MKALRCLWRRTRRLAILVQAKILSFIWQRSITINHVQTSGDQGIWQLSFQVEMILPGRIIHEESLKSSLSEEPIFTIFAAIELAETLCRKWHLKKTPVFINSEGDTVIVFVEVNK